MKKMKMIVTAAVVLFAVSGALAFKPYGLGQIYCIATSQVGSANPDKACTDQPVTANRIDYILSTNPADPTTNPCPANFTPFDNSQLNKCIQKVPGTDHFVQTLP